MSLQDTMADKDTEWSESLCFWCARNPATTRDHVPPKAWFPKPRPKLITVGSCKACNKGDQMDEDLVRHYLVQHHRANTAALEVFSTTVEPNFTRRRALPLIRRIASSFDNVDLVTRSGLYIGTKPAMSVETARVERVMRKVVRALHFENTGVRLPSTVPVVIQDWSERDASEWIKLLTGFGRIGDVVGYRWVTNEKRSESIFLVQFYEGVTMLAFAGCPPV